MQWLKMLFVVGGLLWLLPGKAQAFEPDRLECIAPARPGGGYDIACRLLTKTLRMSQLVDVPVHVRYMPGGVGTLAYNYIISQKDHDARLVTAASTDSALNLAMGKFGKYTEQDVRWLGALGTDFGVIAVRGDSPITSLADLLQILKKNPKSLLFGACGSIGSQDWMKVAMILDSQGIAPRSIRYISYEGGGDALNALLKKQVDIFPGDLTEITDYIATGEIKVLAVLSGRRLGSIYQQIPTAREQGIDVVWPVWRGYYLPPHISDEEYRWWVNTLQRLMVTTGFQAQREQLGLFPFQLTGEQFDAYVRQNVLKMQRLAKRFELQ